MFEYDKDLIERILLYEGFDTEDINTNQICHVPMHEYRLSSIEKPLLLIENLQVCLALYAYNTNFAFAAHLNPIVMRGDEFNVDYSGNITFCNRVNDIFNAILKHNNAQKEPVYIGIMLGSNPTPKTYSVVNMINSDIDSLIAKLKSVGIEIIKLTEQYSPVFIIDHKNLRIITPDEKCSTRNLKKI